MRVEKYIQKCSQPSNRDSQVANNHDYLNFVKRNTKLIELSKNKVHYPSVGEIARHNSIFIARDKATYKAEKLTTSINVARESCPEQVLSAKKIYEIIERKNQQIQENMGKERQSMSDIVYNYSKFRSMEQNYYRSEKGRKKEKEREKVKSKELQALKFPLIPKNSQEIFTIEHDFEGKKLIKVNLGPLTTSQKKKSQSLISEKEMHPAKPDLNFFKKKKVENQFGIEIKSINTRILEGLNESESTLRLKRETYLLYPFSEPNRTDKSDQLKPYNSQKLNAAEQIHEQLGEDGQDDLKKQFYSSESFHQSPFTSCNPGSQITKQRPKFSVLSLDRDQSKSVAKIEQQAEEEGGKECEILYFRQKEKGCEGGGKKDKKTVVVNSDKELTVYDQKMSAYRQFLFMINFAHFKFDPLLLREYGTLKNQQKYKYYIGNGNNSLLVKSLFQRRFWWTEESDFKKANLAWTQLKIAHYFQLERTGQSKQWDSKLDASLKHEKKKKIGKGLSEIKSKVGYKAPLPPQKQKIFTSVDKHNYELYESNVVSSQMAQRLLKYSKRLKYFEPNYLQSVREEKSDERMHNHLEFNHFIGNKKALFYNLKHYYELKKKNVFDIIPLTFHIKQGSSDPEYFKFIKQFKKIQNQKYKKKKSEDEGKKKLKNVWIIKPGELSNRGNGIVVIDQIYQLNNIFKKKQKHNDGNDKTYIVQKYIENPLLYKGRKFDIRHYMLITKLHGLMRAYWYGEGYIRTSSYDFDLDDIGDEMIHLTNDAIQKNCTFYGKHEEGNKLSYLEFQKYMDQKFGQGKCSFTEHIYPKMKSIATDAVKSTYMQLQTRNLQHNFQIFGLDFMIDQNFNVWLIEVNTNPCLEISSKLLGRIIPNMLQHAFRLSLDVIYPPPCHYPNSQKYLAPDNPLGRLNYELIFDEARDSNELVELYKDSKQIDYGGEIKEDNEIYENEGKQLELSPDLN